MSISDAWQPPGSALTNAQLVDIFAEQLNLTPDRKKSLIGNICFCDGVDEDGNAGLWSLKDDYVTVSGGRFGRERKHTLSDVPNHFVRDFLLEQVDDKVNEGAALNEDQRNAARKTLYPDLTADQLSKYSQVLKKKREDDQRAYRAENGIPEEDATPEQIRKCALKRIMLCHGFKHERQAETVLQLHEAAEAVDTTVDLTSSVRPGAVRDYEKYGPLRRSVLWPGPERGPCRIENMISPPLQMDRDCDQIRLIIRRFCLEDRAPAYPRDWEFNIDNFHSALGITRQSLASFLKKKGPENGVKSQAYELAWEFFKRRELIGYPSWDGEVVHGKVQEMENSVESDADDDEATEEVDVDADRASGSEPRPSKRQNDEAAPGEDRSKRIKSTAMPRRRSERLKR